MPSTQAWPPTVLHKASSVYLSKPAKASAGKFRGNSKCDAIDQNTFLWSDSNLCELCHEVLEASQGGSAQPFLSGAPPKPIHSLPPRQRQLKWRHGQLTTRTMLVRLSKASQSMTVNTQMALAAVKRILQEARELANDSSTDYHAAPLEVFSSSYATFSALIAHCLLSRTIYLCVSQ